MNDHYITLRSPFLEAPISLWKWIFPLLSFMVSLFSKHWYYLLSSSLRAFESLNILPHIWELDLWCIIKKLLTLKKKKDVYWISYMASEHNMATSKHGERCGRGKVEYYCVANFMTNRTIHRHQISPPDSFDLNKEMVIDTECYMLRSIWS